jgi:membrane-bound metal-dependent hydrolase YbcI (DUF457 family)
MRAVATVVKHVTLTWKRLMRHPERLAGVVLCVDAILARYKPGVAIAGALDETAHLATTMLIGGPFPERQQPAVVAGALLGSILIDVDHVPLLVLKLPMESAADRPMTHSLVTLAAIGGLSRATRGQAGAVLLGIAAGTTCHFIRDLATGGMPLAWPASRRLVRVPYAAYAVLLAALVIRARHEGRDMRHEEDRGKLMPHASSRVPLTPRQRRQAGRAG